MRRPFPVWFLKLLMVINIGGSVYGYYWYRYQLASTPPLWWPVIPDSPLATTLLALALAQWIRGRECPLLSLVACTANLKYGLWAVTLISDFWAGGGPLRWQEAMLWASHLGMAAQGGLFLFQLRITPVFALINLAWMVFNDLMDYGVGLHPYFYTADQGLLALVTAGGLTLVLTLTSTWRGLAPRDLLPNRERE